MNLIGYYFRMDYSRSQTPVLPKNVEDGVNKFRVGEDFALAHRLQGQNNFLTNPEIDFPKYSGVNHSNYP